MRIQLIPANGQWTEQSVHDHVGLESRTTRVRELLSELDNVNIVRELPARPGVVQVQVLRHPVDIGAGSDRLSVTVVT